jgi:hypothetical protein
MTMSFLERFRDRLEPLFGGLEDDLTPLSD